MSDGPIFPFTCHKHPFCELCLDGLRCRHHHPEEAPPMPDSTLPTWEDSVRAAGLGPRLAQALRIPAIRGHVRAGAAGHAVSAICEAFPDIAAALATTPPLDVETLACALRGVDVLEGYSWEDSVPEGWRHRKLAQEIATEYTRLRGGSPDAG